ncbi:MAG: lipopolysaccharide biosynthesis protein [Bradyrhizobiaceae bacterium]|nr:lipopolysaccharide biosynthesis protein [Bradyrhizobiaceae bacterium]
MPRDQKANGEEAFTGSPTGGQLDLGALMHALWRRKYWIVLPAILVGLIAAVAVNLMTPVYRSEAQVLIENRETAYNRPEGADRSADRDRPDTETVQSQVQLAYSRDLARTVIADLKLATRPEFNPEAGGSVFTGLLRLVGLARDPSRLSFEERVLERYYERLSAHPVERSRVIAIEFRSENAVLAAEAANAVANQLLKFQQRAKQESMRQAAHWLSGEIEQLRARVADTEAKTEEFRAKSNLFVGSNNTPLSAQQLAEANSQLVLARTQKAEAESKARMIREMLKSGRPIEASEIVNSELIRRLNEQRVTLRAQLAEQSSTLLDQHPRIKELKAQIADLEAQVRVEAEKLARTLESDARIMGARVDTLAANLEQVKKQASALGVEDVQLRALEREAKSQRDLLESYLARYRDVTAREGPDAVPPDARILSQAVPSSTPYFPKKLPTVLIAMFAMLMAGATIVVMQELLSGEAYAPVATPLADSMPAVLPQQAPSWIGPSEAPAAGMPSSRETHERKVAALVEHIRRIGRGIVVVTGTEEADAASRVALELARELGRAGARVLYLDFDPVSARSHALADDPRAPGLADLLFGVATFSEVIHRDPLSPIHVIPMGHGVRDAAALLAAERLAVIFGAVSQTYDHVILATPPLASLKRGERLARFSRAVVLVASEDQPGTAASASDTLAAKGFANIVVATASHMPTPPEAVPPRAAA